MTLALPLKEMYLTQGYGQNLVRPGFYRELGFPKDKHPGFDLRAPIGTPIYAACDGWLETSISPTGSKNIYLWSYTEPKVLRRIGHLHCSQMADDGKKVKRGEQIGLSGNSGKYSSGPHVHWDIRFYDELDNGSKMVRDYSNGYLGYRNPTEYLPRDIWYRRGREFKLPVDDGYGEPPHMGEMEWLKHSAWHYLRNGILFTDRQKKALRHGYWGVREIKDPIMFHEWSRKTKPQWLKEVGKL